MPREAKGFRVTPEEYAGIVDRVRVPTTPEGIVAALIKPRIDAGFLVEISTAFNDLSPAEQALVKSEIKRHRQNKRNDSREIH